MSAARKQGSAFKSRPPRNNTSGVVGVGIKLVGERLVVWTSWCRDGTQGRSSYSVVKYGGLKATELAMRRREAEMDWHYTMSPRAAWTRLRTRAKAEGLV